MSRAAPPVRPRSKPSRRSRSGCARRCIASTVPRRMRWANTSWASRRPRSGCALPPTLPSATSAQLELRSLREFLQADISVPETIASQVRRVVATLLLPSPRRVWPACAATNPGCVSIGSRAPASRSARRRARFADRSAHPRPRRAPRGEAHLLPTHGAPVIAPLDELGNFEFFAGRGRVRARDSPERRDHRRPERPRRLTSRLGLALLPKRRARLGPFPRQQVVVAQRPVVPAIGKRHGAGHLRIGGQPGRRLLHGVRRASSSRARTRAVCPSCRPVAPSTRPAHWKTRAFGLPDRTARSPARPGPCPPWHPRRGSSPAASRCAGHSAAGARREYPARPPPSSARTEVHADRVPCPPERPRARREHYE